jgi:23S rRNA (guanosine2251-2'-O)-methyltransferase
LRETLYGRQAIRESLRAGRRKFHRLLISQSARPSRVIDDILACAQADGLPIQRVARRALDQLAGVNHQGVLLETGRYPYTDVDSMLAAPVKDGKPPLILALDLVQDPQNLGALLRTADAVALRGVILQERRAAAVTPAVVRSSSGAVEHLRVARVTNIARTIQRLQQHGYWAAGLDASANAQSYDEADLSGPLALVVGSEGQGLRRLVRERCDFLVRVPMEGHVSSLNAAVAGSVVLYEAWRQRRSGQGS